MTKVVLPELGSGVTKATVSYWFFKPGEAVKEKDDLVELCTDKATFNVPAPCAGTLAQILIAEGVVANVGDTLGEIE